MRLSTGLVAFTSLLASATAHTLVWGVWRNAVDQGDGRSIYIRSPPNNNPVKDLTSDAVACNVNNTAVPEYVPVQVGDALTFEWYHNTRDDDILASSHKGPVLVYIAPAASNGSGPVWVKIFQAVYTGTWATDQVIAAHGQHSVIVPDIPTGDYLFRAEIVALHEADALYSQNPIRGVQLYMSCSQIRVTSNGSKTLPTGVSFPGAYTDTTPGIQFNIYTQNATSYVAPGPPVWSEAVGGWIGQVGIPEDD
ncbi:glycoside hydrolase family 61 protein [Trametopsis cervina]|nr:glycoside hydrolase family 61 protein [Trametopsis cervina]